MTTVTVDWDINLATLDSLRAVRRKLYGVLETELSGMSLEDQVKYGASLHQVGLAVLKLEAAKLKGVNQLFKEKESDLKEATAALEANSAALKDTVKMIRAINEGLSLVTHFVQLLD
ncbi:MAG: hypothetical protein V4525_03240 [Pseudomonadota bacterium]